MPHILLRSSLLNQGMLVNIQQPLIQSDGTLLLATDAKVPPRRFVCVPVILVIEIFSSGIGCRNSSELIHFELLDLL